MKTWRWGREKNRAKEQSEKTELFGDSGFQIPLDLFLQFSSFIQSWCIFIVELWFSLQVSLLDRNWRGELCDVRMFCFWILGSVSSCSPPVISWFLWRILCLILHSSLWILEMQDHGNLHTIFVFLWSFWKKNLFAFCWKIWNWDWEVEIRSWKWDHDWNRVFIHFQF